MVCLDVSGQAPRMALTAAATPTAAEIMARVAASQDKAEAARARYVYTQHAKMTSRRGSRVMCEEITDYRVTPSGSDSHFELAKLDGRLWQKGRYLQYDKLKPAEEDEAKKASAGGGEKDGKTPKESDAADAKKSGAEKKAAGGKDKDGDSIAVQIDDSGLDRDLVENMRENLLYNKSKDGIDARLFPLTSKAQADYTFEVAGRERLNGRDVFHIVFRPKDKSDFAWKGDAYIDTTSYEPVLVSTGLSRKIPFAVRTFLGTNVPGLGFTIVYAPQSDGVWFPTSFSTEFKIRVLFFFRREIVLDAQNREFEKTHVETKILDGMTPVGPER